MYCKYCGAQLPDTAVVCLKCGSATGIGPIPGTPGSKSLVAYVLLGVFLGSLGIHNFYAGYTNRAVAQLLITVLSCFLLSVASWIWAIVDVCTVRHDAQGNPFV